MKVAIMGAGLSGLACAIELERNGIEPFIFEKRSIVGDRFVNGEVLLSMFARPIQDEIQYLSEEHNIYLQPTANISRFVMASRRKTAVLEGRIGFSNIRGRHENSFEQQLKNQLKAPIHCDSCYTYEDLLAEYTHVVVATGDASHANSIVGYDTDLSVTLMGRSVQGSFSRYTIYSWFDERFAPKGHGYLIPYSETEANIVIAYPEYGDVQTDSQEQMWTLFQNRVETDLNQSLITTDSFHIHGYPMGTAHFPRVGNTFFVGNNLGSLMPFFGFGQFTSILSGIYAARDICGRGSYEESIKGIQQSYRASLVMRRAFEKLNDDSLDLLVQKLSGRWGHWLLTTRHDVLKWVSYALRLWTGVS
ncbi:FAD-dependent oxidoreductase [Alicyclobacillus curvatus]|jgi:flavin-dependent dehydrogenase|nr:FAD-dependent oxidoreductase [Alicyclobacillus curvatus]